MSRLDVLFPPDVKAVSKFNDCYIIILSVSRPNLNFVNQSTREVGINQPQQTYLYVYVRVYKCEAYLIYN